MFHSHPGPIAQIRCGKVQLYYNSLPLIHRYVEKELPEKALAILKEESLASLPNVVIWMMSVEAQPPPLHLLNWMQGLVIAGMGTGGFPSFLFFPILFGFALFVSFLFFFSFFFFFFFVFVSLFLFFFCFCTKTLL